MLNQKERVIMVYVTMTDKFMSGWGMAEGKINKLVIECKDRLQAEEIADYARSTRDEMKYINISYTKPHYNPNKYLTSWEVYSQMTGWIK